jgi:hypothetical protein
VKGRRVAASAYTCAWRKERKRVRKRRRSAPLCRTFRLPLLLLHLLLHLSLLLLLRG